MAEFNIRTDGVDVEQIMRQIRARIRDKRGVDYTEEQLQELASVKLEKFLDAKGMRSDLVDQFRRSRSVTPPPPNYGFEDTTLFESHRAPVRWIRTLLRPILKLFFNPNTLIHVLHEQSKINDLYVRRFDGRDALDALYYEVIHNLVLEITRLGIEVKNLKMRLESMASRLDFDERRARALEGVVQYRPGTSVARDRSRDQAATASAGPLPAAGSSAMSSEEGQGGMVAQHRRRRRRGRRGRGGTPPTGSTAITASGPGASSESAAAESNESESSSDRGDDGPDGGPSPSDL
jgi:hypothetical protein